MEDQILATSNGYIIVTHNRYPLLEPSLIILRSINESMTTSTPVKRSLEDDAAAAKRVRRSRWESADKKEHLGVLTCAVSPAASSVPASNATTPKGGLLAVVASCIL